ncbi:MAG: GNAT family N-acetyltransferase [Alphaproteobacteria bacterium]|nr:GNAT family N-acetyltransferase [Alphaproteobacteria bacterium]
MDERLKRVSDTTTRKITVRLAANEAEIEAAQRLRYTVFYEEYGARSDAVMAREKRDFDTFDSVADHLIVVDDSIADPTKRIVGTYRLIRQEAASRQGRFYTSDEYDIAPLLASGQTLLELGRSCVLSAYRIRPVLQMLWQGITDYMLDHKIDLMFGCASFHTTDSASLALPLSYLYHWHLAPAELRPRALPGVYVDMDMVPREQIDPDEALKTLPPLIKGYIRLGSCVGDGAFVDRQFGTTDVCIVFPIRQANDSYRRFYARKVGRPIPGPGESFVESQRKTVR